MGYVTPEVTMEITMEDLDHLRTIVILHNGNAPWNYMSQHVWYVRTPNVENSVHEVEADHYGKTKRAFF